MSSLQNELDTLKREVRALQDRQEIADCINRYCRGLDRLDADALRSAYHPGALDRHGPFYGDREQFVPWAIEIEAACQATQHNVTTHICELQGDSAHAETYCVWFALMADGKTIINGAARYIDHLERRDGAWAIVARCEVMDFSWQSNRSDGGAWEQVKARRDRSDLCYQRPLSVPKTE